VVDEQSQSIAHADWLDPEPASTKGDESFPNLGRPKNVLVSRLLSPLPPAQNLYILIDLLSIFFL
jgi:hypothetical protein